MGTRGAFGVRIGGVDKITYNHFDSYPSGLGRDLVDQVASLLRRNNGLKKMRQEARAIKMITENPDASTMDEIVQKIGDRYQDKDVYSLLRNLQGNLKAILTDAQLMITYDKFLLDSLFCEYAYIVNLDTKKFEIYLGFQTEPHKKGRYASKQPAQHGALPSGDTYYPVALAASLPLDSSLKKSFRQWFKDYQKAAENES